MININTSFNQSEYYKDLIRNEQPLKRQFIFIVSDEEIRLLIYALGYSSIFLDKDESINNFINFTVKNSLFVDNGINENGDVKADASYISNFIYLPCLNKYSNEKIINTFRQNYIKVDKEGWKVFTKKGKNLEYYKSNLDDLESLLEEYTSKFVKVNNHNFDMEKGKISPKKLDMEELANYLVDKYKIIKIEDTLYYYCNNEKYYIILNDEKFTEIIMQEVYNTTKNKRKEYYPYIKKNAHQKEHTGNNYLVFKNGILDIKEEQLLPFNEEIIVTNKIQFNYTNEKTEETQEKAEKLLSTWANNNDDIIQLIYEIIGYALYRTNPLGKTFFLQGSGGNGKSTFFDFLTFLFGNKNVLHRELEDFDKEYNAISLNGKMLTICDDIDNKYISKVGVFKKIVTGEYITGRALYESTQEFRYMGKLLLSGNEVPRFNDTSNGLGRRLVILPFKADLRGKPNINFRDEFFTREIAEYILYKSFKYLKKVLLSGGFTKPEDVTIALKEYHRYNNPVIEFIEENKEIINTKACSFVYSTYKNFCDEIGAKPLGRNAFYKKMEEQGYVKGQVRVNDENIRQFIVKF